MLLAAQNRGDCFSEFDRYLLDVRLSIQHVLLDDFLRAQPVVFAGDVRIEIPQFLCLFRHGFFYFVDFPIDFRSQLFKITANLFFVLYICIRLGGDVLHSLQEGTVIG